MQLCAFCCLLLQLQAYLPRVMSGKHLHAHSRADTVTVSSITSIQSEIQFWPRWQPYTQLISMFANFKLESLLPSTPATHRLSVSAKPIWLPQRLNPAFLMTHSIKIKAIAIMYCTQTYALFTNLFHAHDDQH